MILFIIVNFKINKNHGLKSDAPVKSLALYRYISIIIAFTTVRPDWFFWADALKSSLIGS